MCFTKKYNSYAMINDAWCKENNTFKIIIVILEIFHSILGNLNDVKLLKYPYVTALVLRYPGFNDSRSFLYTKLYKIISKYYCNAYFTGLYYV